MTKGLSKERFSTLTVSLETEQTQLKAAIPEMEAILDATAADFQRFIERARQVTRLTELTPEIVHEFIEKIVVHEKEVKWSKHAPQTVEIYYNGIGYVGSGRQDVEEALEAPEPQQTQDTEKPRQAS